MMSSKRLTARERNSLESMMEKRHPDGPLQGSCVMLHGFLTAIISGPLIPTSEWIPIVFGDDTSTGWESLDKAKRGYELLMRFNNEIAGDLLPESKEFAIMIDRLGDPPEHLDLADDWCEGYMIGTSLREREWSAAMQDPVVGPTIEPIRILGDRKHPRWRKVDHDGAEYRAIMDQLPASAVDIWDWWRGDGARVAAGDSAKVVPFRRPTPKLSPNAPCPCGSGKKYKRCCGTR